MKIAVLGFYLCCVASGVCLGAIQDKVVLEFFYEPGCLACERIEQEVLPEVEFRYGDLIDLRKLSLNEENQYFRLVQYLEASGTDKNAQVFVVVNGRDCLAGFDIIAKELIPVLDRHLSEGVKPELIPTVAASHAAHRERLDRRVESFTLGGVLLGGLVDGLNPCALATLVFLLSVLGMAGLSGRELLAVGGVFCLASFLAYTALGFGLLGALHLLERLDLFRRILDVSLVVLLLVFALISLRDAWAYARTAQGARMLLRLPSSVQRRVHRVVRSNLAKRARLPAVFMVGVLVTGLESVCTGQVYVPTLVMVLRGGRGLVRAGSYLLLYNTMFVLPLVVAMLMAAGGMKWTRAADWSRRHVVMGKILLALFFLGLAGGMLYLHGPVQFAWGE